MTAPRSARWRTLAALVLLHLATAAPWPWEDAPRPWAWLQPSADLAFLLAVACITVQAGPVRGVAAVAALATAGVPLYRFGETLLPVFYGKPFEPWVDLLELPGLVHLVTHRQPPVLQVAMLAGTGIALLAVLWVLLRLWRTTVAACQDPGFARVALLCIQALCAGSWLLGEATGGASTLLRPSMLRAAFDDAVATVRTHDPIHERVQAAATELARTPQDLGGLGGADVYLLILESYGRGILGNQARAPYEGWLAEHQAALTAAGWQCAAGWIAPSVRGGGSSLAHAELLSGIEVEDRRAFDHLLATSVRTLAAVARDAGYHTVDVQPGMPRAWPEAKALGFTTDVFQPAFPYAGRRYHWGVMPDQFALQHVLATVVRERTGPLFVQYVGVTSHAPFTTVPPYYEDWARAADPAAFRGEPAAQWAITWTSYVGHPQIETAYLATIRYCLRTAFGFALQLSAPSLVIVLGDHQPPLPYRDSAERLYDVPIHVLSNRPELLAPLLGPGLEPGLVPGAAAASFAASRFLFRFLRAYGKAPR